MNMDELLEGIQAETSVKTEFRQLLESATKDSSKFIQESAEELTAALIHLSRNELSMEDVETLLKKQKTLAKLEASKAHIEMSAKIQKTTFRMLDIASNVLVKAIPGSALDKK